MQVVILLKTQVKRVWVDFHGIGGHKVICNHVVHLEEKIFAINSESEHILQLMICKVQVPKN